MRPELAYLLLRAGQPETWRWYSFYERAQWFDRAELEGLQLKRAAETIGYAYEKVPFYRAKFRAAKVTPESLKTLDDLRRFPATSVAELREAVERGTAGRFAGHFKTLATTGSTGTPFSFPLDTAAARERMGCLLSATRWYGHDLGLKNARFWRTSETKALADRIKQNLLGRRLELSIYDAANPAGSFLDEARIAGYLDALRRHRPGYIDGYVSALVLVSDYMLEHNVTDIRPRAVVTGAEYLSPEARRLIEKAFACPVYNRYGGTENSLIAHDCPVCRGTALHVMSAKLVMETLSGNAPAREGELGEVAITDFTARALPFIRFLNGDTAVAAAPGARCACGRGLHLVQSVEGRVNDLFPLKDGRVLVSHVWHKLFREHPDVRDFQVIQKEPDRFEINLALHAPGADITALKRQVESFLPGCSVFWNAEAELKPAAGGKFRHCRSEVPFALNQLRSGLINPAREVGNLRPYVPAFSRDAFSHRDRAAKLDWNEAPPPPPDLLAELADFVKSPNAVNWYADVSCSRLLSALAAHSGLEPDRLAVFPGSDGALDCVARTFISRGDTALIAAPSYDQFRLSLEARGAQVVNLFGPAPFEKNTAGLVKAGGLRAKLLYIANPNNPTGVAYTPGDIAAIARAQPETLVLVDEAYVDFCPGFSVLKNIAELENVIVTRTFSKLYGLAGLRIGWLAARPAYIEMMNRARNLKETNALAQKAGELALARAEYFKTRAAEIAERRDRFAEAAAALGYEVKNTPANFIMLKTPDPRALCKYLADNLVFVRDRSSMPGLAGWVRVTIGSRRDMDRALELLRAFEN
ncbi:MAG: aminotransferase class I/II-fold pyridoxal phosphate-dependent enzyme [Elusimicrobiaceae bacterium]|nr:aminotransferase class I/II-fold pyridoxal phosphate-dependent enzyme [Elusimicrobiaceae bacterium]